MRVNIYLTGTLLRGQKEVVFFSGNLNIIPRVGDDYWAFDKRTNVEQEWKGAAKLKVSEVRWFSCKNYPKETGTADLPDQMFVELFVEQEEPIRFTED